MVERKLIRPALRDYRGARKPPQEVREPHAREVRQVPQLALSVAVVAQ